MQKLDTHEKLTLIREHGDRISRAGTTNSFASRQDLIDTAYRAIELLKSIPKAEMR